MALASGTRLGRPGDCGVQLLVRRRGRVALIGVVAATLACASSPTAPTGQERALAPIESVGINVAESFPPQYFAAIVSLQRNACVTFDAVETTREGNSIRILVWNLIPADPDVACAQVISTTEHNVALGTDFESGQSYGVQVNDVTSSFKAQ